MKINYTNWKGENSVRNIIPLFPYYGSNGWHSEKQWLLKAWDIDKKVLRSFAVRDIKRPFFLKYKKETFGGWDITFVDWSIAWEWEYSEKYGKEWSFKIEKFNHTYNDSRLPDTLFYLGNRDFSWRPTCTLDSPFKEVSILGLEVGVLIK